MATTTETNLRGNGYKDDFFTAVYRFFDGMSKHMGGVWGILALVIVVGVAGGIFANRNEAKSESAKNALFLGQKAYETEMKSLAGVKPPAPAPAVDPKAAPEAAAKAKEAADKARQAEDTAASKRLEELSLQKLDVDAKFPETTKKYREVIAQFGGTRSAYEARMNLGDLYYNHGEAAKAEPLFKDAADAAPGKFEKALAYSAWGYAHENLGKFAEAAAAFDKALGLGETSLKGDLLMATARCQAALHDNAKAKATYDQVIAQLPGTEAAKSAELLKGQLQ